VSKPESGNIPSLDSVRGVAILLVIVSHFMIGGVPFAVSISIACANAGVILFFFLSGFLMERTFAAGPSLPSYVVRRVFRILPMYWLSIALIYFLQDRWSESDVLINATFTAPLFHVERMSGVFWTLYIEVLFYALVPIVFALGTRAVYASTYIVAAIFVVLFLRGPTSWAPFYIIYCFSGMQVGAWSRGAISWKMLSVSILSVAAVSSFLPIVSPYLGLAPLACCALLCAAIARPLRSSGMELIGNASYSWYLLHPIFGYTIRDFALSLGTSDLVAALTGAVVTLALSLVTLWTVERPMMKAGKEISRRWRRAPAAA
jgi:peptidoglycan/LPS O-acetylase OafA/YrhL